MLIVPTKYYNYKILAIDPGLNNCGIAIYNMDYITNKVLDIEAFTLVNDKLRDDSELDEEMYTERVVKLYKLKHTLQNILSQVNPSHVVCESPFYSSFRPTAYAALVEVLRIIHTSVMDFNLNISFSTIEPLLIKKLVGAGMQKGKIDVKEAVSNRIEIMTFLRNDINRLDEHSIDAVAIGFSFLKMNGV